MHDKIIAMIASFAKRETGDIEGRLDEKGLWDSFSHVELVLLLESEFGVFFEQEEIAGMNTPRTVIEVVQNKQAVG